MKDTISVLCLVLLVSVLEVAIAKPNSANFIECLHYRTSPKNPVTDAIFTPDNTTTFLSSYLSYTKNKRYSSPNQNLLAIVVAEHVSHVQATVVCAKTNGIQLRTRSGGHDLEALSYISSVPFVILDMHNLRSITIDVPRKKAWVQAGATLGELYVKIKDASKTLAFPAGVCPTVGAGGHISGGGYGNLIRKYGITVDHVVDALLVDVNGKLLNRATMGEDLFWAIRGGGGASFGVILSWKINLVEVPKIMTVFRVNKTLEQGGTDVLYKWQLVSTKFPEDLFIRAWPQVVNGTKHGERTIAVVFYAQFLGRADKLMALLNKNLPGLGLKREDCHEMSWIPANATAYPHRKGNMFKVQYSATWLDASETETTLRLMRELYEVAEPYVSSNPREAFFNYRDIDIGSNPSGETDVDEAKIYGTKYFLGNLKRLMQVKAKYDPENFFKNEQSIPPVRFM
ncbi:hypothetical protein YC2023_109747 [Brassica napus]